MTPFSIPDFHRALLDVNLGRTSYQSFLSDVFRKPTSQDDHVPLVLDLFAGCGGLSLGFHCSGFEVVGFEKVSQFASTHRLNAGECSTLDLRPDTDFSSMIDLGISRLPSVIIGGPPCQPFSKWRKGKGENDDRDGFPAYLKAVSDLRPDLFLFENVKGLLSHSGYFSRVIDSLSSLGYSLNTRVIDCSKIGVPQKRERLIVTGTRFDATMSWDLSLFDEPSPVISCGVALADLLAAPPVNPKILTPSMDEYILKYERASSCKNPRDLHLNKPARTLTCRNISGGTSDMHRIRMPDGRRRMLEVNEAARLQSFPDWFEFSGSETKRMIQIGNAVPPLLGLLLARSLQFHS